MTQDIGGKRGSGPKEGPVGPELPVALVIGDGQDEWMLPEEAFIGAGCQLVRAANVDEAAAMCSLSAPDLVFMPLTLDGRLTSDHLRHCLAHEPAPVVVVLASNDQINAAAEAMRLGAHDCLFKPFSQGRLVRTIEEAVRQLDKGASPARPAVRASRPIAAQRRAAPAAKGRTTAEPRPERRGIDQMILARHGFVAASRRMRAVLDQAAAVAASGAPVFVSGEVGTGKTVFASILHEMSPRAQQPLVTLPCGTLTAADFDDRMSGPDGLLARAAGGTLYFDEIADLPAEIQPRVLRLIERLETGVGGPDVRIIASTSHDSGTALRAGIIRPDLYFRLHVAPIDLPPLRAREGDPALIARVRLSEFSEAEGRGFTGFTDTALAMISGYHWPGNLRELVNVIWTLVLMNQGPLVTPDLLPSEVRAGLGATGPDEPAAVAPAGAPTRSTGSGAMPDTLVGRPLAEIERLVIEATIRAENGSVPRAARVLGVSPSTLYRKREAWDKTPNS